MRIKKGVRVIDKYSGDRGEIRCRKGREVFINWDEGIRGEMPWPVCDFVIETAKTISRYCVEPKEAQ